MRNIRNDMNNLSIGAGQALDGLINVASDMAKVNVNMAEGKKRKDGNCAQM